MRLALFVTCLVDGMFPEVGKATVGLLERLGQRVEVPLAQTCCGQAHINTGYAREALPLVRRHVASFAGYDAVVVPSGSCAGSVRHQHAGSPSRPATSAWRPPPPTWRRAPTNCRSSWSTCSGSPTSASTSRTG
jgi:Cysteine-rich domain